MSLQLVAQNVPPIIEKVQVNGIDRAFKMGETLQLEALDDDVIFTFNTIPNAQYQFQLKNHETRWLNSQYPEARYTNLSGGDYKLKVKTTINGKTSSETTLSISTEGSLTEMWWFYPAVVFYAILLISAGIYFLLLNNFRQKLKVESIRHRIASDLHDEVGATLSSIAISIKLVAKKLGQSQPTILPILAQIKSDSEDSIQSIRDTVWTINPENDSTEQLLEKMRSFALQILMAEDIAFSFDNQIDTTKKLKISMEQRRNTYMIYKEAINNIAKHAKATKVNVLITQENEGFRLEITDNGKGFDQTKNHEGNGLKNFKKRADESFMQLDLASKVGEGTRLSVLVFEM